METDIETIYLEDVCRICMSVKETENRHNIFEQVLGESMLGGIYEDSSEDLREAFDSDLRLSDAMQWIFSIGIYPDDGLPTELCESCEHRVVDSFLLRHRAKQSHQTLLGMRHKSNGNYDTETIIDGDVLDEVAVQGNHISGRINEAGDDIDIVIPGRKGTTSATIVDFIMSKKKPQSSAKSARKVGVKKVMKLMDSTTSPNRVDDSPTALSTEFEIDFDEKEEMLISTINKADVPQSDDKGVDDDGEEDGVSFLLANYEDKESENPATATGSSTKTSVARAPRAPRVRPSTPADKDALRNHQCNVCEKRFMRKSNLIDHLRLHANMRPYECEICKQSFVQTGNLRAHMRIHTKERPYKCQVCGKTYNQSGALKVHIRVHTNERNYKCSVCQKAFTNSSDRNKHERVHDVSAQIKCDLCDGRLFAQRVNFTLHMRKHHGLGPDGKKLSESELAASKKKTRKPTVVVRRKDN